MPRVRVEIRERHKLAVLVILGLVLSILFTGRLEDGVRQSVREKGEAILRQLAAGDGPYYPAGDGYTNPMGDEQGHTTGNEKVPMGNSTLAMVRLSLPMGWIALSFTTAGAVGLYMTWIGLGFSMGVLLWMLILAGNWRGPFLFWAVLFPQSVCYLPALLLLYIACLRWNEYRREGKRPMRRVIFTPQTKLFALRLFLGLLLYGLGIWLEVRVNPWILKKTL